WSSRPGASSSPRRRAFGPWAGAAVPPIVAVAIASGSPPVVEPVGVVGEEPAVRVLLPELDLVERAFDLFALRSTAQADQAISLVDPALLGIGKSGDGGPDLLAGKRAGPLPEGGIDGESQVRRQVAVVGEQGLIGHL